VGVDDVARNLCSIGVVGSSFTATTVEIGFTHLPYSHGFTVFCTRKPFHGQ
jgi:hypothetical protein